MCGRAEWAVLAGRGDRRWVCKGDDDDGGGGGDCDILVML